MPAWRLREKPAVAFCYPLSVLPVSAVEEEDAPDGGVRTEEPSADDPSEDEPSEDNPSEDDALHNRLRRNYNDSDT